MKSISVIARIFLVIFVFIYGVVNVGGQMAMANAAVISNFLGQDGFNLVKDETVGADEELDTEYFKSDYTNVLDLKANGEYLTQLVMEEGAVLLKNDNNALPLVSGDKVSLFSASSVNPVVSGYRENYAKKAGITNLLDGFKEAGLSVNEELYNWYKNRGYSSIGSIQLALDFLWYELETTYTAVLNTLKTAKTIREASDMVLHKFENPADQSVAVEIKRCSYGQGYYDQFAGTAVDPEPQPTTRRRMPIWMMCSRRI
jgi:hypothetical protein